MGINSSRQSAPSARRPSWQARLDRVATRRGVSGQQRQGTRLQPKRPAPLRAHVPNRVGEVGYALDEGGVGGVGQAMGGDQRQTMSARMATSARRRWPRPNFVVNIAPFRVQSARRPSGDQCDLGPRTRRHAPSARPMNSTPSALAAPLTVLPAGRRCRAMPWRLWTGQGAAGSTDGDVHAGGTASAPVRGRRLVAAAAVPQGDGERGGGHCPNRALTGTFPATETSSTRSQC